MKNKKILIIIFIIIIFFILSIIFSLFNFGSTEIISGVSIGKINVSKLSKEKISELLNNLVSKRDKIEVILRYSSENDNYEKNLDLSVLNIKYNLENSINKAYSIGKSGNIFQCNFEIAKTFLFKRNIDLDFSFDEKKLDLLISDISSNLPNKMIQSGYYIENGNLIITKGSSGLVVDKDLFKNALYEYINDLSIENSFLLIPVKEESPEKIDLDKIHKEIYKEER